MERRLQVLQWMWQHFRDQGEQEMAQEAAEEIALNQPPPRQPFQPPAPTPQPPKPSFLQNLKTIAKTGGPVSLINPLALLPFDPL